MLIKENNTPHDTKNCRSNVLSSRENLVEFREIFRLVDKDGGGSISSDEIGELLHIVGIEASKDELDAMIKQIDVDNSGEIDFEEFASVMTRRVKPKDFNSSQIKDAFKFLQDIGGSPKGKVHVDTIVKYMTTYASEEKISEDRARELAMQMEVDCDGYVHFEEYVDMMMNW